MAKYTVTVFELMEEGFYFGLRKYPIFDSNYRKTLNHNILNFWKWHEIGVETREMWREMLNDKLQLEMPYYNQLYLSTFKEFDPFVNVDLKDNSKRKTSSDVQSTAKGNSKDDLKGVFSGTPQGTTSMADLESLKYATNTDYNLNNREQTSEGKQKYGGVDEYFRHLQGRNGIKYPAEILKVWRGTFLNIDKQVCEMLKDLFMQIY